MDHYWKTAGREVIHCHNSSINAQRPTWNPSVYHMMREIYVDTVGPINISSTAGVNNNASSSSAHRAMQIPYEIQHIPGKGRGIIATELVPKHQMIWNAHDHVIFEVQSEFERFLARIGYDLACDVLMWAYVEPCTFEDFKKVYYYNKTDDDVCFRLAVELGDASLMNSVSEDEEANVVWCGVGEKGVQLQEATNCSTIDDMMYANRDFQPGEEILTEYNLFSYDGKVLWFDELYDDAWFPEDDEEDDEEEDEEEDDEVEDDDDEEEDDDDEEEDDDDEEEEEEEERKEEEATKETEEL